MNRIHLLDESVASRIAAGEVVTNPAAVVKELIENSIDAGANSVTVEIVDGGKELIRVTDNGSGMHPDDVPIAVQKHATSKIGKLEDLGSIATLGFRGEALSSMAAVARLSISSRTLDNVFGITLEIIGGGTPEITQSGLPEGTTIKVENLFYNIPARKKFLKSSGQEAAKVTNIVAKMILSNPKVAFKYLNNAKLVYQSPGNGDLRDALITVYGKDITDKIKRLKYENDFVKLSGYISKPSFLFRNTANINFYLNGRYFQSKNLQEALLDGYGERLLRSHFPFAVLHITSPYDYVDVNVHPAKLQLMFFHENQMMDAIRAAVSQALQDNAPPKMELHENDFEKASAFPANPFAKNSDTVQQMPDLRPASRLERKVSFASNSASQAMDASVFMPNTQFEQIMDKIIDDSEGKFDDNDIQEELPEVRDLINYRILGQVFQTYLLCESGSTLYFIDQHAAHERINYESMKQDISQGHHYSQQMMIPTIKKMSPDDFNLIQNNFDLLSSLGFDIEEFGVLSIRITALPSLVDAVNVDSLIDEMLFELRKGREVVVLRDKIIRAACRHSVKAGDQLSGQQISALIKEITEMDAMPTCPHGRPIAVVLTKADLKKGFKRTV